MIGMGALGILFGHPMSKALGDNFRMIANTERIARYKTRETTSNGEVCKFNFITPDADIAPADLIIIAVKSTTLDSAIADIASQVGENTIILSLLNGISSEEILEERWPNQVIYSVSNGMDATREAQALIYEKMGFIQYGEADGSITERVTAISKLFDHCCVPYEISDKILYHQWRKMIVNVGVNAATAIYGVTYSGISADGEPRDKSIAAMRELIAIAAARNIVLGEDDITHWLNVLSSLNPDGMPSMRQDVLAKRMTEKELFSGTVCRLGKKYGIATPVNDWYYAQLAEIENNY